MKRIGIHRSFLTHNFNKLSKKRITKRKMNVFQRGNHFTLSRIPKIENFPFKLQLSIYLLSVISPEIE